MGRILADAFWFVVTSILWGATNPLIKQGGEGVEKIKCDSIIYQYIAEFIYLFTKIKYVIPFLINQCGSVIFYVTLASADISLAVPITNSLTFIFTGLSGKFLGEKFGNDGVIIGVVFVLFGITLCVTSKMQT